jgi:hypothetical protein
VAPENVAPYSRLDGCLRSYSAIPIIFRGGEFLPRLRAAAPRPCRCRRVAAPSAIEYPALPFEFPWPGPLVPVLRIWLDRWRLMLCSRAGRWARPAEKALWISCDGSRMAMKAIFDRVFG